MNPEPYTLKYEPLLPYTQQVNECYLQFLETDMNVAGAGCLPPTAPGELLQGHPDMTAGGDATGSGDGSGGGARSVLRGRFVVQVDEVVNTAASFGDRYGEKRAGNDRTLKLSLTDGTSRVVAYEYRPMQSLHVNMPAGVKVGLNDCTYPELSTVGPTS